MSEKNFNEYTEQIRRCYWSSPQAEGVLWAAGRIKALEKALVAEERFSRASGDIVGADNLLSILEKADE